MKRHQADLGPDADTLRLRKTHEREDVRGQQIYHPQVLMEVLKNLKTQIGSP